MYLDTHLIPDTHTSTCKTNGQHGQHLPNPSVNLVTFKEPHTEAKDVSLLINPALTDSVIKLCVSCVHLCVCTFVCVYERVHGAHILSDKMRSPGWAPSS